MSRIAILQSSYIPWKGYFDIIHSVDEFVWYDDVQYTSRDWRTRNLIKTANGTQWLTVPCNGRRDLLINQVELKDPSWQEKHWKTLYHTYAKAPFFKYYREFFEELYLGRRWEMLYLMNRTFIENISKELLGIETRFYDAAYYNAQGTKQDRLLDIIVKSGANTYISGPAAKDYIDEDKFTSTGIDIVWMDYRGYPEYPQLFGNFIHTVTILDLLFNVGDEAPWYIWGWRENADSQEA